MNTPIQPPAPVNPVISIQPVVASVSNNAAGGTPNPLANVPMGTLVEGFVINRDAQNNPILRTSLGDLRVGSEVFLKTGSEVVFRVDAKIADLARILTVDGMTPEEYNAQNAARSITKDTISSTALQSPATALAQTGKASPAAPQAGAPILQAILLQGQPQAATAANPLLNAAQVAQLPLLAQLAQLRAGTPLRLTLLDLKLPPLPVSLSKLPDSSKLGDLLTPANNQPSTQPSPAANAPRTAQAGAIAQPLVDAAPAPNTPHSQPTQAIKQANSPIIPQTQLLSTAASAASEPNAMPDELKPFIQALHLKQEVGTTLASHKAAETIANATQLLTTYTKASHKEPTQSSATHETPTVRPNIAGNAAITNSPDSKSAPATHQAANIVTAQVIGHDAEGANILHTSFGSLKLYTSQPLPTGTSLVVQAEAETTPTSGATSAAGTPPAAGISQEQAAVRSGQPTLAALDEAFAWLATNHPELAHEVQQRLPNLGPKLTSGLLFFIAAIKGGDIQEIFGRRALRQLEQSIPELLARARQEIASATTAFADTAPTQWAALAIPMLFGQEIHQLKLYVSRDPEDGSTAKPQKEGQRFILEVSLSELGPMQFDGFVRKSDRRRSFDLMVRSASPLEEGLSQTIRELFHSSMEGAGMNGQVIFQSGSQHFVRPSLAPSRPQSSGDGVQTILA